MNSNSFRILGLAGSLRRDSYNRALLRATAALTPSDMEIIPFEQLDQLPFYDGDVEALGEPATVRSLRAAISAADALLLVTPEYNDGTSAVLKNAIDWASRPPGRALAGKLVAVMGASVTPSGARGGIESVKRSLRRAGATVLDAQVAVPTAGSAFDSSLVLTDAVVRAEVADLLRELATRIGRTADLVAA